MNDVIAQTKTADEIVTRYFYAGIGITLALTGALIGIVNVIV